MIPSSDSPLDRMISANSRWRGCRSVFEQQPAHPDHRVHRRADLVAHRGQERPLGLVGLLGEPGLLFELGEQVGVADCNRCLLGEHLQDASVMWLEWPDLVPVGIELAIVGALDHQRCGHDAPSRYLTFFHLGARDHRGGIVDEARR